MRTFIFSLLIFFSVNSSAQGLSQKVTTALEHIQQGAILQGVEELKSAARSNFLIAQYYIGICYEYGIGIAKNPQEAYTMYRKAAERGLADAMFRLATCYKEGFGVGRNTSRSEEWLSRYHQKKGYSQSLLPDLITIYNKGIKHHIGVIFEDNNALASNRKSLCDSDIVKNTSVDSYPIALQPILQEKGQPKEVPLPKSDVDIEIPVTGIVNSNSFAVIIANENYQDESKVEFAINDGEVFSEYCRKTLGIPKENVHLRKDATFNNIKTEINWMEEVAKAYKGKVHFIFYYAGHGFPDEASHDSFLLPVDGNGSISSTGYNLAELYQQLGNMPSQIILVFLDACFSGAQRSNGMLASTRGISIKAKENIPTGKVIVFSATNGQQTAYPLKEKGHGMFTYYLLKHLKNTKGSTNLGELYDYMNVHVSQQSVVINSKPQTPTVNASASLAKDWRSILMK